MTIDGRPFILHPGAFVLGSTLEYVAIPVNLVGRLEGRSSIGRLGVIVHASLPYDSPVLFLDEDGVLGYRPIGELVENRLGGRVVAFDPDGRTVTLRIPGLGPTQCMEIAYDLKGSNGEPASGKVHNTIHRVGD